LLSRIQRPKLSAAFFTTYNPTPNLLSGIHRPKMSTAYFSTYHPTHNLQCRIYRSKMSHSISTCNPTPTSSMF
jgi:hypothetical protein